MARPRVISLFSGAGGLDYGFEAAGFDTVAAVEMDGDCCKTLKLNRKHWQVLHSPIAEVSSEVLRERTGGDIDVLIGGPPCQPFSKAGYWASGDSRRLDDPRASTLSEYIRVVSDLRPRAILLENVLGLAYEGKDEGLRLLQRGLERINRDRHTNYRLKVAALNAADYGVPQLRERVFLIASRDGAEFNFPAPTHGPAAQSGDTCEATGLEPYHSAWDAIGGLPSPVDEDLALRGKWAGLLPSIPEGYNYLWHTDRLGGKPLFGWRTRYWSFLLKLAKDKPSWTIQAQPGPSTGPFHWDNRRLSMRELCRLQTFPDNVKIFGARAEIQRQLGNAVPSLIGEVLARAIRHQLLGRRRMLTPLKLAPQRSAVLSAPSMVRDVPEAYLRLAGRHEAHPGPRLGPKYQVSLAE